MNNDVCREVIEYNNLIVLNSVNGLCGINLFEMPLLTSGYHPIDDEKLELINSKLKENNLPLLEKEENPLYVVTVEQVSVIVGKGFLCQVRLGEKTLKIVTKMQEVTVGQKLVVALPGAVLYNGIIIEKGNVYGHLSEGVFCSRHAFFGPDEETNSLIEVKEGETGERFYGKILG